MAEVAALLRRDVVFKLGIHAFWMCFVAFLATRELSPHPYLTPWIATNILIFPFLMWIGVGLHQLAHAATARAVGVRVYELSIGEQLVIRAYTKGGTRLELGAMYWRGHTAIGVTTMARIRLRLWLTALGGPLITIVTTCIVAFAAFTSFSDFASALAESFSPAATFVVASGFILLGVVFIPEATLPYQPEWTTDAEKLLTLLSSPDNAVVPYLYYGCLREAVAALERGDLAATAAHCRTGLEHVVDDDLLSLMLITTLPDDSNEKLPVLRALAMSETPAERPLRGYVLNLFAWACYERRDAQLLAEAEHAIREALVLEPDNVSYLDTLGHVLVWAGRHDEAIEPLTRSFERGGDPRGRAYGACGLALASTAAGDDAAAERWLVKARELAPDLDLLRDIDERMHTIANARLALVP